MVKPGGKGKHTGKYKRSIKIKLLAVNFNHSPTTANTDALNLRRNAIQPITLPEWNHGMKKPEDSLAAYAIKETKGKTITITAKFARTDAKITTIEVRTTVAPKPKHVGTSPRARREARGRMVLGEIKARKITFKPTNETDFETFELQKHEIQKLGVGIHYIKWQWFYRINPTDSWTIFAESNHKIYTVLEIQKDPWKQQPFPDSQNPWTDLLDYACSWAAGQKNVDDAAGMITKHVNESYGLSYDMRRGAPKYTKGSVFEATKFIDYLKRRAGLGRIVNCMDCATIVTTFANSVGCDLHASRMGWSFDLTKIKAIGQTSWGCPGFGCGFSYHEVAWKGGGNRNDPIFDACLKIDSDDNPWANPHKELLPKNIPFTTLPTSVSLPLAIPFTANSYRERLCTNTISGISQCKAVGAWPGTNNGRREVR